MANDEPADWDDDDLNNAKALAEAYETLLDNMGKVIVGQREVISQILLALFSQGHCLLEGVPGLAKTLMVSTLGRLLDLSCKRIQFTPDLMPSDITGTEILEEDVATGHRQMKFVKGPIFGNILLADELNRTPPKTQAALLQAMQEYYVTAAGQDHVLDRPFLVLGTQNPIEQEGTYPLPEAQLDRFFFKILIDYPSEQEEVTMTLATTGIQVDDLEPVLTAKKIVTFQQLVRKVLVAKEVANYAVKLVRASRPRLPNPPDFVKKWLSWGAGPRACQALVLAGKARALVNGRYHVSEDDIRQVAKPVLRHRLVTSFQAETEGKDSDAVIEELINHLKS